MNGDGTERLAGGSGIGGWLRRLLAYRGGAFWSPERSERTPDSFWMAHPRVRRYINHRVTGDENVWPLDWFMETVAPQSGRALVPGCGLGELDRHLVQRGAFEQVDALDVSESAIEAAREVAQREGIANRITYQVCAVEDFDAPRASYDACFFHHALHHFPQPGRILDRVRHWLKPGGLIFFDEYVGPNRRQWDRRRFAAACFVFEHLVPRECKARTRLAIPGLAARMADPTESVASDVLLEELEARFEIARRRDYGGFILQPLWGQIDLQDELVEQLIGIEEAFSGLHPAWFTNVIATRTG